MSQQVNPKEGTVSAGWDGVSSGFREVVTFDMVNRALNDEYIFRRWRRCASEEPVLRQGGMQVQGMYREGMGCLEGTRSHGFIATL